MPYKVIDIFNDLPKTNCGECHMPGCFQFATAVYIQGVPLAKCPYLLADKLQEMNKKLEEQMGKESGRKKRKDEQAIDFLMNKLAEADFAELAKKSGSKYIPGPPQAIELHFLNNLFNIQNDQVTALSGEPPSIWIKTLLLIYLTRAQGAIPKGRWAAFRELPNSAGKSKSFDRRCQELADDFNGRAHDLKRACENLGGVKSKQKSTDVAYEFEALPRVKLLLLFFDGEDGFEPSLSVLLDADVLDYLDQEATLFLLEAFSNRLRNKSLKDIEP